MFNLDYRNKKTPETIISYPPGCYEISKVCGNGDNKLYYGDNLGVLASFLDDKKIAGNLKLVYIDPPFSTSTIFESRKQERAYHDNLVGPEFVEFLRERLILIHQLLSVDGSLYLHLDERMIFHCRLILDEIFGEKNFRNFITRKKCNSKNYTKKTYGNVSDYILFYTKSDTYTWNRQYVPWNESGVIKEYPYVDSHGRRHKRVSLHAPGVRNGETGKPWRGKLPPTGKHWQYKLDTLDEMDKRGDIYWSSNGNPRRKVYLETSKGISVQDIWLDTRDIYNQNVYTTGYPTEKNPSLLNRIIKASSNPGDLVMDCFAGSGTTLSVASVLGRRWIGVDNSEHAINTILSRFMYGSSLLNNFISNDSALPNLSTFDISNFTLYKEIKSPD